MISAELVTYGRECAACRNKIWALHICGMILLVLWDGHLARPLYFSAGETPTLQESSLDSATYFSAIEGKI
ncbi:MAG: hypothetical protein V7K44_01865 [Nostoc sp.]